MGRKNGAMTTWLLCKLILVSHLPFYQICSAEAADNQSDPAVSYIKSDTKSNCDDRIAKIEAKGNEQEKEILKLKTTVVEDREIINFISERVARLEQSAKTNEAGSDVAILTRPKRPYRLIPVQERNRENKEKEYKTKNNDEENYVRQPFYGPATSCDELGKIGYTLNGYYLVNGKKESHIPAIEIIYCYYKNTGEPNGIIKEERFGVVTLNAQTVKSKVNKEERLGVVTLNLLSTQSQEECDLDYANSKGIFEPSIPTTLTRPSTMSSKLISKQPTSLIVKPNSTVISKGKSFKLGKKIPLEHKDENSYLLMHNIGKCLAVSTTGPKRNSDNGAKIIMSDCNPSEKGQLWKLTASNLCNEWGKCLTVDFKWNGGYTSNIFHWENIGGEARQSWSLYDWLGSISHFGLFLSVNENSNPQEAVLNYFGKSHDRWSFYTWNN